MPRLEGDTYFNNFIQSGYEELRNWSPSYYRDIREADANFRFAGWADDKAALALEELCRNLFIDTMDPETIARMERFFHLEENESLPMEERRSALKAAQLGNGKIGRERISDIVRTYTGYTPNFDFIHRLKISSAFDPEVELIPRRLLDVLRKVLPAHLAFLVAYSLDMAIDESETEGIRLSKVAFHAAIRMWPGLFLDGSWILDGSELLDFYDLYPLGCHFRTGPCKAINRESLVASVEEKSPGFWLLDGDITLDGTRNLDSEIRKEIIE